MKLRQLWGTDEYTDDSDLVAVLVHTGHVKLKAAPQSTAEDKVAAYRVLVARAEASDAGSEEAFAKAFSRAFTADRV